MVGVEGVDRLFERQPANLDVLGIDLADADAVQQPQVVLAVERKLKTSGHSGS